jgi:hypothetical protein
MTRKNKIKISLLSIVLITLGLLTYEFLYGKFFALTPLIAGFTKYESPHANIYIQKGAEYSDFTRIDTLIPKVEEFYELQFLYKPKIFIFRDSSNFIQRSLSKARFSVYPNSRLLISPWALKEAAEGKISLEIYLRHELSHSLLDQYAGIIHAYKYPQWLMEGVAVYCANQMGTSFYPSKSETYRAVSQGNFVPPLDFKTKNEDKIKLNVKYRITFMYSEFACIVDYLVINYGKEKLLTYVKKLLENSNNNEVFQAVYNIEFFMVIQDFKEQVNENENRLNDH